MEDMEKSYYITWVDMFGEIQEFEYTETEKDDILKYAKLIIEIEELEE
jgi:hypothetical protein